MTDFNLSLISPPHLNFSRSVSTSLIYFTSKQGRYDTSLTIIAAVSPFLRDLIPRCRCNNVHDHHILLPQVEETAVALLLQFVKGGIVSSSLRLCTQLLEILKMLGVDTSNITLEKVNKVIKEEEHLDSTGDVSEERGISCDLDVAIVYEGQSTNVSKAVRVSYMAVKSESNDNSLVSSGLDPSNCRGRLPPLRAPTPPSAPVSQYPSSSLQGYNFNALVSLGMARRLETRTECTPE